MLTYPSINPVLFSLGPLSIHWYGLMYVLGFVAFLWLGKRAVAREPDLQQAGFTANHIDAILQAGLLGVLLGGRIGYCLIYQFPQTLENPLLLFRIHEGGMSFHGGFLGVLIALYVLSINCNISFYRMTDLVARFAPIGLGLGRIGNFINGELWGRVTSHELPWSMVFTHVDSQARHPSMLYQAFLEGVVLYVALSLHHRFHYKNNSPEGMISVLFLWYYSLFRFMVEFFREPDSHLGFVLFGATMGQVLSIATFFIGLAVYGYNKR